MIKQLPRRLGLAAALVVSLGGTAPASAAVPPASHAQGSWSTICPFTHRAMDDPIVFPSEPGLSHMHDFIGNASTNAFTTHRTLLNQPPGDCTKFTPQPQNCAFPMQLWAQVFFPDCSDGRADSHDHMRHMAYARFGPQDSYSYRTCPAAHPIPVPMLHLLVEYPPKGGVGAQLASGGRYSLHADFFEAWRGRSLQRLIHSCLQADLQCQGDPDVTPNTAN